MSQLFALIASFLATLIGSYFMARFVDQKLTHRKKWLRITLSLIALVASFIAIAYASGIIIHFIGPEFRR